jgi:hypothetical protein
MKKPQFKKSEIHGNLPCEKGIVVSVSKHRGGVQRYNTNTKMEVKKWF